MTKLSKDFAVRIKDGVDPERAYFLGMTMANLFQKISIERSENGVEDLKAIVSKYDEIEIVRL